MTNITDNILYKLQGFRIQECSIHPPKQQLPIAVSTFCQQNWPKVIQPYWESLVTGIRMSAERVLYNQRKVMDMGNVSYDKWEL